MKLRNSILMCAAAAMAMTPVAAQAANAASMARTESPVGETEQLRGAMLIVVIAIVAGLGLLLLLDDDDEPESP